MKHLNNRQLCLALFSTNAWKALTCLSKVFFLANLVKQELQVKSLTLVVSNLTLTALLFKVGVRINFIVKLKLITFYLSSIFSLLFVEVFLHLSFSVNSTCLHLLPMKRWSNKTGLLRQSNEQMQWATLFILATWKEISVQALGQKCLFE